MYAPFFGLRQEPFSIAPDPRYLYMSERHREALAHLLYGLGAGGGFVLLTGEIGTGKTTVCRCFLEQIPANCNVGYIFNPKLTVLELLQSVCDEFHVQAPQPQGRPATVKDWIDPLNAFLLKAHAEGRNNVLIIDEAQNLSPDVLEQLRLLTNLETSSRKLLQIILIGQPELRDMLARPQLEQLAQRVVARFHLTPLGEDETARYVHHRLQVAGLAQLPPFERRAIRRIHRHSRGIPRRINLLCDRAMLGAYAHTRGSIGPAMVDQAAREVFGGTGGGFARHAAAQRAGVLLAGAALVAAAYWAGTGAWRTLDVEPVYGALGQLRAWPQSAAQALRAALASPDSATTASGSAPGGEVPAGAGALAAGLHTVSAPAPSAGVAAATDRAGPSASGAVPPGARPTLLRDEEAAWRELAQAWKLQPPADAPVCPALAERSVSCFSGSTSVALLRQLDRPGIVTLDANTGRPSYALLVALTPDSATLRASGTEQTVTLDALAARWDGEFATFWRTPVGYTGGQADLRRDSETLSWAARQLAGGKPGRQAALVRSPSRLRSGLRQFQAAQGLPVSGMLTPLTYMQLNRVAGVDEPRLRPQP